jgi:hypothetical protein
MLWRLRYSLLYFGYFYFDSNRQIHFILMGFLKEKKKAKAQLIFELRDESILFRHAC